MADEFALEVLQVEVAKLSLKPGDILVLRLKGDMTADKRLKAGRFLNHLTCDMKVRCAILDDTAELQIVEGPASG